MLFLPLSPTSATPYPALPRAADDYHIPSLTTLYTVDFAARCQSSRQQAKQMMQVPQGVLRTKCWSGLSAPGLPARAGFGVAGRCLIPLTRGHQLVLTLTSVAPMKDSRSRALSPFPHAPDNPRCTPASDHGRGGAAADTSQDRGGHLAAAAGGGAERGGRRARGSRAGEEECCALGSRHFGGIASGSLVFISA